MTEAYKYDELPEPLRVQVIHIWREILTGFPGVDFRGADVFYRPAQRRLCEEYGVLRLTASARTAEEDVCEFFLKERDITKCLKAIEIVFVCLWEFVQTDPHVNFDGEVQIPSAIEKLNRRFQECGIGYEFLQGKFVRIDSGFLHQEVVTPAMLLLREAHLTGANEEFLNAHQHFRHGRYPECINDCLNAFESTMKAICQKRGWSYDQSDTAKRLLTICEANGLFPAFMQSSLSGLRSVLENVATVRNKLSGHGRGVQPVQVTPEVAAFALHSTGANIL